MAHLMADWNPLDRDIFYRKFELYSMEWPEHFDLSDYDKIATAAYGGPIAVVRDDRKLSKLPNPAIKASKPIISIFSAAGKHLSSVRFTGDKIIYISWSNSEELLIVQDDGVVLVYDYFGQFKRNFSMGQEARETKILDCKVFNSSNGTGIAVITTLFRFFFHDNIENPRIRMVKNVPDMSSLPNCWTILSDESTQAYLVYGSDLYIVGVFQEHPEKKYPRFNMAIKSITDIALSVNRKHLALFTDSGILWIGSADTERLYCEFDTKTPTAPKQVVWCGSNAVVVNWTNVLMLVGLNGKSINYYLDSSVHLSPEIDGVRLVGNYTHELLQKVPTVVTSTFMIGSMAPGSILLEASKEFQKKSHHADEYLRTIKDQLEDAITQCVQAAGYEYFPSTQKMLLRAAAFGKGFIPDLDPEPFVTICKMLRVLNAVRDHSLAIPITYSELEHLTMPVLVDRLVLRHHYCLAIKICQYLGIPDTEGASKILSHWAKYKIMQANIDEDRVAQEIADKVGFTTGVSYSDIAFYASENRKARLATKLLDYEPRASKQVPLLINLKEHKPAISKAIESGDTDLIYSVIMQLHREPSQENFLKTISKFPAAYMLYLKYCRTQNLKSLKDLYYQEDNFKAEGDVYIIESYQKKAVDERLADLQTALDYFRKSRNEFLITHTEEQIRLLRYQRDLKEKFKREFVGKSLHQTVALLLEGGNFKLADELRKTFKMPEKRYYWIKIQVYAELGDWPEIEKLGKKSPIGYEALIDIYLKYKKSADSRKYLPKVQPFNKVKYYVKTGLLEEASLIAMEQKDEHGLSYVQSKCGMGNKNLADKIQAMKLQLSLKR